MTWLLNNGGVSAPFATWGLVEVKRQRKSWGTDTVTFRCSGLAIDAPAPFAQWSQVTITDPNGNGWFQGLVTKIPVKGSTKQEDQYYLISGPWWYFENLVLQQDWMVDAQGNGNLVPTLRSTVIVGQNAQGVRESLAAVTKDVVDYVQTAGGVFTPGAMLADATIPFTEIKDQTCAQVLISIMAYVPDAVQWFDYTTSPPTLNISRRGNLAALSLAAYAGIVDTIDLTPRADLVVPAVVLKYIQDNNIDGQSYTQITPDIFPVGAPDPAFRNFVCDVELLPSSVTYEKQALTVTDRPIDYDSVKGTGTLANVTWAWLTGEHRAPWLKSYTIPKGWPANSWPPYAAGDPLNDTVVNIPETDFTIRTVKTTLVSNYKGGKPATTTPPSPGTPTVLNLPSGNVPAGGGPGTGPNGTNALDYLSEELLTGSVTPWMTDNQDVYSAHVVIEITIQYTGSDPVVAAWFSNPPTQLLTLQFPVIVTNGATQTYSQLASDTPGEPMPVGLAQIVYEGLSVLHYEGTITTVEQECSGQVGLDKVLNLSGSPWAGMQAQVQEVTEDVDQGKTTIRTGPPKHLSAGQMVDILRAVRGRIQSYHLNQQTTGKSGGDNTVDGAGDTARSGATGPPVTTPPANVPWSVTLSKTSGGQWQATVNAKSYLMNSPVQGDVSPVDGLGVPFNINPAGDCVYLEQPVSSLTPNGDARVTSGSVGGTFDPTKPAWDGGGLGWLANDGANPPNQTYFRVPLGVITSVGGTPVYTPWCVNNLQIFNVAVNGEAAIMAYPTNAAS